MASVEVENGAAVTALWRAIQAAFPPTVFQGAVTPADEEQWAEEIDDDLDLRDNLRGRTWKEVPDEIIDRQAGGLPLLTPEAFAAFLPAWLVRSLDRLDAENEVREFTVYQFCRLGRPSEPQELALLDAHTLARFDQLNTAQVTVLCEFLSLAGMRERDRYIRESAQEALLNVSSGFISWSPEGERQ
jgi:hypothetical protein